jgi:hypothetical protein
MALHGTLSKYIQHIMTNVLIAIVIGYALGAISVVAVNIYLADKRDRESMDLNSNE